MAEQVMGALSALERSALATAARESVWLYPAAELVHIAGFVLLVGAATMFDLRLLGLSRTIPVTALARHLLPWARLGLLILLPTGFVMFASDPITMAANPAFRWKLVVIAAGVLNALHFHLRVTRTVHTWDRDSRSPLSARAAAVISLLAWFAALAAGRLIAYV